VGRGACFLVLLQANQFFDFSSTQPEKKSPYPLALERIQVVRSEKHTVTTVEAISHVVLQARVNSSHRPSVSSSLGPVFELAQEGHLELELGANQCLKLWAWRSWNRLSFSFQGQRGGGTTRHHAGSHPFSSPAHLAFFSHTLSYLAALCSAVLRGYRLLVWPAHGSVLCE